MSMEVMISILTAAASLAAGGVASTELFRKIIPALLKRPTQQATFSERLAQLTANLTEASREVDGVLAEMAQVSKDRAEAVMMLETDLNAMEGREGS